MLDQQTGHQNKLKIALYKKGELLYWTDYWNATFGIGVFVEYVNNFNVTDIYATKEAQKSSAWVMLLINSNDNLEMKMFPQTSVSEINNHQSVEDFQEYVSKFRFKRNR